MGKITSAEILLSLKEQIKQSKRKVEILDLDTSKIEGIRVRWPAPDSSLFGTITRNTGGIIFDNWIRLLGAGERDIASWNDELSLDGITVVADDILGGLFGYGQAGSINYFAPDTLEWEDLEITYSQFIQWLIEGDVDMFYESFRWDNWEKEVNGLKIFEGVSFFPYLWAESKTERSRRIISLKEIITLYLDMAEKLYEYFH